jgi:hypothetical protein
MKAMGGVVYTNAKNKSKKLPKQTVKKKRYLK